MWRQKDAANRFPSECSDNNDNKKEIMEVENWQCLRDEICVSACVHNE